MTKNEERKVLEQIEKLIASTGADSYISMAFAGCCDMARSNIDNDFANNPQEAILTLRKNLEEAKATLSKMESDKSEFEELYCILIAGLGEDHAAWVKSNFKMRSIESARSQIKTAGDISCNPAMDVLNEAYEKEKHLNASATQRLYARKELIREIERYANEHGKDWNGTYDIFGY